MSFSHLATVGTLEYAGYAFDGASQVEVSCQFVTDEAGRTVLYHEYTITVHAHVADSSQGTDGSLESIRARLGKAGQTLRFINKGFGDDLIVNSTSGGGLRDVKFGPIPKELSWKPVGSAQAAEITWQITTCVPKCSPTANSRTSGIMSINYSVNYEIDRGFTTRTITGHLVIAQTRRGSTVPDCADLYRRFINPVAPDGYERKSSWDVSLDKSRIDFTITDTQLRTKNPYPQGVVAIDGKHRVSWAPAQGGYAKIRNSLSVDIELASGISPSRAWLIFGQILQKRIAKPLADCKCFLESIDIEEDLYGHRASFNCTYRILTGVEDIIGTTGLFQPVDGNWRLWRASLPQVFDSRGYTGLALVPGNDLIVDLCGSAATIPWNAQAPVRPPVQAPFRYTFQNKQPKAETSYLHYDMQVEPVSEQSIVRQQTLEPPTGGSQNSPNMASAGARLGMPGTTDDVIQQSGSGRHFVALVGSAVRVGHEIPRPAILKAGTQTVVEAGAAFATGTLGNYFGQQVYRASWRIVYMLQNSPQTIKPPGNLASQQGNAGTNIVT